MQIPLNAYLEILRAATPDDNALTESTYSAVGPKLVALMRAAADFVEAMRDTDDAGYGEARDMLEALVHTFPLPDSQVEQIKQLRAILQQMGADATAATAPDGASDSAQDDELRSLIESAFGKDYDPDAPLGDDADGPMAS